MSKVFERIPLKQINDFMTTKTFPHLCSFKRNDNPQHSLVNVNGNKLEKNEFDKEGKNP